MPNEKVLAAVLLQEIFEVRSPSTASIAVTLYVTDVTPDELIASAVMLVAVTTGGVVSVRTLCDAGIYQRSDGDDRNDIQQVAISHDHI